MSCCKLAVPYFWHKFHLNIRPIETYTLRFSKDLSSIIPILRFHSKHEIVSIQSHLPTSTTTVLVCFKIFYENIKKLFTLAFYHLAKLLFVSSDFISGYALTVNNNSSVNLPCLFNYY